MDPKTIGDYINKDLAYLKHLPHDPVYWHHQKSKVNAMLGQMKTI